MTGLAFLDPPLPKVKLCDSTFTGSKLCLLYCVDNFSDDVMQRVELMSDDNVRIRTKGNGPFVETITRLDAASTATTVCNYSGGEHVGSSWTDKIMAVKSAADAEESKVSCEAGEGAADDEWDD